MLGSNKVLQVALGKTEADELRGDLHRLSERIAGHAGLFFTSLLHDEVCGASAAGLKREEVLVSSLQDKYTL